MPSNNLTTFKYATPAITGNRNHVNLLKIDLEKNREITSGEIIFGGFSSFETNVYTGARVLGVDITVIIFQCQKDSEDCKREKKSSNLDNSTESRSVVEKRREKCHLTCPKYHH